MTFDQVPATLGVAIVDDGGRMVARARSGQDGARVLRFQPRGGTGYRLVLGFDADYRGPSAIDFAYDVTTRHRPVVEGGEVMGTR